MPRRAERLAACALALAIATGAWASDPAPWKVRFVDIAPRAGLVHRTLYGGEEEKRFIIETNGSGVAWIDADDDGWIDALVPGGTRLVEGGRREDPAVAEDGSTTRLYRNDRDGTFTDITATSGLGGTRWASGVCVGDYDNDGLTDLLLTAFGRNELFRRTAPGRFEDVTARAGLPAGGTRWGSGCSFLDYDRDGRLDLFVANYLLFDLDTAPEPGQGVNCLWKGLPVNCGPKGLPTDTNLLYHNEGDGTFRDVSDVSGIAAVRNRYPMTALALDVDEDGWVDLYVASDSTAAILYRNNRDGTFTDVGIPSGAALSEHGTPQAGMGAAAGDYNGDGRLDLFKTHFADDIPALYRAIGKGRFEDVATAAGLAVRNRFVEWGASMADFDNDGFQDLLYVTGNVYPEVERHFPQYPHRSPTIVFRNRGDGTFEDVSDRSGAGATTPRSSRGSAAGDFDQDGDLDLLVMNMNAPPSLLRNDYAGDNRWLVVRLEGTVSNRSGLGATVVVTAKDRTQARAVLSQSSYQSADALPVHFGLGPHDRADRVEVRWPSGRVSRLEGVKSGQVLLIREPE